MQSLSRQLKRRNTVIIINTVTKSPEFVKLPGHNKLKKHILLRDSNKTIADNYRSVVIDNAHKYQQEVNKKRKGLVK